MSSENKSPETTFQDQQDTIRLAAKREVDAIFEPGRARTAIFDKGLDSQSLSHAGVEWWLASLPMDSADRVTSFSRLLCALETNVLQTVFGQSHHLSEISELREENRSLKEKVLGLEQTLELIRQNVVDLSEMVLSEVALDDVDVVFARGLRFSVSLSDDKSLFIAQNECLHIRTFGASRAELLAKLRDEVAFLWMEYACADDSELSPDAIELKGTLRSLGEEISDAAQGS
ncbi:MAG: hypothetical protein IT365_14705 [Candidatus Hydrogenedentes bacterium]|nr:hypothetical protein [Candidatus Hydrogenedentota bacterium]